MANTRCLLLARNFILALLFISYGGIALAVSPNITTTITAGIGYCNACPHNLCREIESFGDKNYTFSCWTRGQKVANDTDEWVTSTTPQDLKLTFTFTLQSIWLYSYTSKCYIPQFNLDYEGTGELCVIHGEFSSRLTLVQPRKIYITAVPTLRRYSTPRNS